MASCQDKRRISISSRSNICSSLFSCRSCSSLALRKLNCSARACLPDNCELICISFWLSCCCSRWALSRCCSKERKFSCAASKSTSHSSTCISSSSTCSSSNSSSCWRANIPPSPSAALFTLSHCLLSHTPSGVITVSWAARDARIDNASARFDAVFTPCNKPLSSSLLCTLLKSVSAAAVEVLALLDHSANCPSLNPSSQCCTGSKSSITTAWRYSPNTVSTATSQPDSTCMRSAKRGLRAS